MNRLGLCLVLATGCATSSKRSTAGPLLVELRVEKDYLMATYCALDYDVDENLVLELLGEDGTEHEATVSGCLSERVRESDDEVLFARVRRAAAAGDCEEVRRLGREVAQKDPERFARWFTADPATAACLAGDVP